MTLQQWGVLAVTTASMMLLSIDDSILALAVPHMVAALSPSATQILWIGDIYLFVIAALLVTMGNVADRIGRKKMLLIGSAGFAAASTLAAFAPSAAWLIFARALQGVFGASIMPSTLSILRDAFRDPIQRIRAIAIWSVGATGGGALGPIIGGVLLEHFWWGAVFLINLPVMLIIILIGIPILRESKGQAVNPDWISVLASVASLFPIVVAIKHIAHDGMDLFAVGLILIGSLIGIFFIYRQRHDEHPLLDISLFKTPAFAGAVSATAFTIFALIGLLFFFSPYLQLVRGMSPLASGMMLMPAAGAAIVASILSDRILLKMGRGHAIGFGLGCLSFGLMAIILSESVPGLWVILGSMALIGFGCGLASPLATDAVVSSAPVERSGAAAAISETAYKLGAALGIALLGSIQTWAYRRFLHLPEELPEGTVNALKDSLALGLSQVDTSTPSGVLAAEAAREAFSYGMQVAAGFALVLVVAGAILAWKLIPSTIGQATDLMHKDAKEADETGAQL